MKKKICLITTGQPSTNPRLVKEADALVEAGYEVVVLAVFYIAWANEADKHFYVNKDWKLVFVGGSPDKDKFLYFLTRVRYKIAKILFRSGLSEIVAYAAASRATPELIRQAVKTKADLYIGHNLGALPAAVAAARKNDAKAGFDAEDFHSEEMDDVRHQRIVEFFEHRCLPQCDYITAASGPIAQAYAQKYGFPEPVAILNVFPLKFLQEGAKQSNPDLLLYWFSQTIGPGRGLEDVIEAMGKVKKKVHLYLQGQISPDYRSQLTALAVQNGVPENKIHFLSPCPPDDLFKSAAQFDVGLAIEFSKPLNKDLCLPNKILTYLLAGLSVIATETKGQRPIIESIGKAGWMYPAGDIGSLAARIEFLCENREELKNSKSEALKQAREKYNWDIEKKKFLRIIGDVVFPQVG